MATEGNKVRIVDIAKMLSVSPATVSLAIHNKTGVSDKVRADVLKVCKEVGYTVEQKVAAPSGTQVIRLCIYLKHGQIINETPLFSELIEGIENEARKKNYELLISYYNECTDSIEQLQKIIRDKDKVGLILLATEMFESDLVLFKELSYPMIVLDNVFRKVDFPVNYVLIDNINSMYDIVEYLVSCGHTKIGYIRSLCEINNFKERQKNYWQAMAEKKLPIDPKYMYAVGPTFDTAYRDMLNYLKEDRELPTAFVVDNDLISFGVMRALKEKGIRIPGDVSIVGFDEMPYFGLVEPSLSTVRVQRRAMGVAAVRRLLQVIEDKENGVEDYSTILRMKTQLMIKESVKRLSQK